MSMNTFLFLFAGILTLISILQPVSDQQTKVKKKS